MIKERCDNMNINEDVKNILSIDSRKIKEETLEEYLNELKKNDLFVILSLLIENSDDVIGMYVLKEKSKRKLIEYISNNIIDILKINFMFMKEESVTFLKKIIERLKEKDYEIKDEIPYDFALFFKTFFLAKFEYNENSVKMFMPKEFVDTFIKILNDKNIELNHKNNEELNYIIDITKVYGIIELDALHKLFNNQMYKIEREKLLKDIKLYIIASESMHIYEYNDNVLICNKDFTTEDMAIDFYNKQKGDYKKYDLKEIQSISNGDYLKKIKSYNDFIEYLNSVFELSDEDIKYIVEFLILNYIDLANISKENADKLFITEASEMFDLDSSEIEDMKKIASNIFDEYPKWLKKGNI